ncbi:hypothetical protein NA57DRAFT_78098 [Rhizodiscina lignyota]|uniref:Nucleoporin Nup159/Nup146 N-terminal domain-containing protein n=1 Tax=Rhizodiscina lignyota TaxID=1504668 RepID=A0A9P4IC05_9PEZI|nr:hypothetical protein NA57DRAFT_78098 [Rhizodiscina lignyota]
MPRNSSTPPQSRPNTILNTSTQSSPLAARCSSPRAAAAPSPHNTIRRNLDLFRPSPPRLRSRSSLSSIHTHSSSGTPYVERKSLDLEGSSSALLRELGPDSLKVKMAFAIGNAAGAVQARQGPQLQDIITDKVGFLSVAGERKLRFLPTPWSSDNLPPPTATLLSISSTKRLVAAAGPDNLVIASTDSVRQAFQAEGPAEDNLKNFAPQLTIPIPRVSQVAFSSDGTYLVICAENGGGLAVYETQALMQGKTESAFQLATNGVSVRALAPNPAPELAHGFAIVLDQGQLMLADLSSRQFQQGQNGSPVLREGVSSVAWSTRGKQLVAGLGDGTAIQMDIQSVKATIPRPPGVQGDLYLSRIVWLTNDEFIVVHTPVDPGSDIMAPESFFHYVSREKGTQNYTFQKLSDPSPPFGLKRAPQHHFISRLRSFPPDLTDLLIVASTSSSDIGMFSRSTTALSAQPPQVTNEFTNTGFQEDSRRAQLPPSDMSETSPIGMSLDFSSEEKVTRPIGDELDKSPTPLPAMMVLNNEGIMCAWWIVYDDSLRQKQPYPELIAAKGTAAALTSPAAASTPFGGSTATTQSQNAFTRPANPAFGASAFGTPGGSAFGGTSALGMKKSPWSSGANTSSPQTGGATFGRPAFGAPAFGAPAFGSSTPISGSGGGAFANAGKSLWGTPASTSDSPATQTKPANPFSGGGTAAASPFSNYAPKQGAAMSSFSSIGGGDNKGVASPFASVPSTSAPSFGMKTEPSFGSTVTVDSSTGGSTLGGQSLFGSKDQSFGTPAQPSTSIFGQKAPVTSAPAQETEMDDADDKMSDDQEKPVEQKPQGSLDGFKLGSTFKPDSQANKDDRAEEPKKDQPAGTSLFGGTFGDALAATEKPQHPVTPIKKEPGTDEPNLQDISTTPASLPKAPAQGPVDPTKLPTIPGSPQDKTPAVSDKSEPLAGSSPEEVQPPSSPLSPSASEDDGSVVDDAPLPPDPTTVKKPSWFHEAPPGAGASATPAKPAFGTPPAAAKVADSLKPLPLPQASNIPSTTPAGFPKSTFFPPPAPKESPRSPSPVRSASQPAVRGTPGLPSQSLFRNGVQFAQPNQTSQAAPPAKPQQKLASTQTGREPVEIPTSTDLVDHEAERVREILDSPLKPSQFLKPFEIKQRYADPTADPVIGNQDLATANRKNTEYIYRDVNDMVDTAGINQRHLEEWILWNQRKASEFENNGQGQREKSDLREWRENMDTEEEERWPLADLLDVRLLMDEAGRELDEGKIIDKREKLKALRANERELEGLRRKIVDIRRWIEAKGDPEKLRKKRSEELPPEAVRLQTDVRAKMAEFKKLLAEAEDAVLMLKAKLSKGSKAPTLEAVTNTVLKVTEVVKQKSADVDVLETQMRKLGLVSETPGASQILSASMRSSGLYSSPRRGRASREGTPFMTPTTPGSMTRSRMSKMWESSSVDSTPLMKRSTRSLNGVAGQRSVAFAEGEDEVGKILAAKKKRVKVKMALRDALVKRAEAAQSRS